MGFAIRSWVLYLLPTQKNLLCDICLDILPRMGRLRLWVGGGTAGQSLLLLSGRVMKLQMVSFLCF